MGYAIFTGNGIPGRKFLKTQSGKDRLSDFPGFRIPALNDGFGFTLKSANYFRQRKMLPHQFQTSPIIYIPFSVSDDEHNFLRDHFFDPVQELRRDGFAVDKHRIRFPTTFLYAVYE